MASKRVPLSEPLRLHAPQEQYRDALERQIAEQQRHKRPQPTGSYQEDPEDGYLSGASLPGHRAEDQRHRSRLSKVRGQGEAV